MARKSTSSSAANTNGHPQPPANGEGVSPRRLVPGTNREVTEDDEFDFDAPGYAVKANPLPFDPSLLPNGSRSLSSIGLQAFGCGFMLASCLSLTACLVAAEKTIWRLPAFFACLSLFHFLEFWTTARFNLPAVRASSFLLFSNGVSYNVAHTLATIEIVVSKFFPWYQSLLVSPYSIIIGVALILIGQMVRSIAMAQAGTNFNHTPQKFRKDGHELVTRGVYARLRHPAYFGFFWWALGTQVVVGNKICFVGYLFALWNFFHRRIRGMAKIMHTIMPSAINMSAAEEITLVDFFDKDYEEFRKRTGTGIPFIR